MADKQSEPFVEGVHAAENVDTGVSAGRVVLEAGLDAMTASPHATGLVEGAAIELGVAAGVAFALQTFGVLATAEDKVSPVQDHPQNHSTSVPASDPHDPHKVPNDEPQTSHGPLMSHAPEISSHNPLMSQDPQTSGHQSDPQTSGHQSDPQTSGHQSDPQMSGHQSDPQMSQAPEVSTHNPDAAPDPGHHHY